MDKKKNIGGYSKRAYRVLYLSILVMMLVTIGSAMIFNNLKNRMPDIEQGETTEYDGHFAFVVSSDDEDFWEGVYTSVCEEAAESNIYIEDMSKSLGVNYSDTDLLRVAINSSVDGIIYGGTTNETAAALIDKAVDEGIGVVILQNDIDASARQCFVGVNNYELGQMFASQIAEIMESEEELKKKRVDVLIDRDMSEGASNVITIAIEDYFSENYPDYPMPEFNIIRINSDDAFSVEDDIRRLFIQEDMESDVMLCLSSIYTQCVYQSLVDRNKVGEVQVIGYFAGNSILEAIEKQIIYSTISVDTDEMGRDSVKALKEYMEMGYTNSYIPISTQVIGYDQARLISGQLGKGA